MLSADGMRLATRRRLTMATPVTLVTCAYFRHNGDVNTPTRLRSAVAQLATLLLSVAMLAGAPVAMADTAEPTAAIRPTANLALFDPGRIITDAVFFNASAMSEAQI